MGVVDPEAGDFLRKFVENVPGMQVQAIHPNPPFGEFGEYLVVDSQQLGMGQTVIDQKDAVALLFPDDSGIS
jgi:hypothetical protein